MEFISRNKRKKSNKVGLSFNINNATKTFKRLIEKHKNEKKVEKKISTNKIDDFFSTLNNAFFKQEIKESDYDYIFREIKNQIRISQNLVDLYGINLRIDTFRIVVNKSLDSKFRVGILAQRAHQHRSSITCAIDNRIHFFA